MRCSNPKVGELNHFNINIRFNPVAVIFDQPDQMFHGFFLWNILLHKLFFPIERYFPCSAPT